MQARYPSLALFISLALLCNAQLQPGSEAYNAWKLAQIQHSQSPVHAQPAHTSLGVQRDGEPCACWIEPDSTYTLALPPSDDGSSEEIQLPFSFNLYGSPHSSCYINNNGNISFGNPYLSFSASPFPYTGFIMVAPFWADVDTRATNDTINTDHGLVHYKVTPHALYVNWTDVGYCMLHGDRRNSVQLIITDGMDPVVAGGNNVSFCYGTMEWTTGDASSGVGGLGGIPATVGANKGDGVNYLQLGRFQHDSTDWNGPYSDSSGVAWLTGRHFSFSTASENIPPIFTSIGCDTLEIEAGTSMDYPMMMIAGGPGQVITGTSLCPGIANYVETVNTPGPVANILSTISPTASEVGLHTINYTAVNDTTPQLTSTYTIYVKVLASTVGVGEAVAGNTLSIRPNPATDKVYITWPEGKRPGLVQVIAADGSIVQTQEPASSTRQMELNVKPFAPGLYTVRAISKKGTTAVKLMRTAD